MSKENEYIGIHDINHMKKETIKYIKQLNK